MESRRVRRKAAQKEVATRSSKASASSVAGQVTCRRVAGPKKRVPSKLAKKAWQRRDSSK